MKQKLLIKIILKKSLAVFLAFILLSTSILPIFQTPLSPQKVEAANSCSGGSYGGGSNARVGGVALDQAATFLANMDDITGAYYDETRDRIVFVGKTNTSLPEFDKDDLAVAIRAVMFNKVLPAVSIEMDVNDPSVSNVLYYGGIQDTRFGDILVDADWKLKQYEFGFDENQEEVTSSVTGYKSLLQRFVDKDPSPTASGSSRFVIRPNLVSLKRDENADSFVFDQVSMEIYTEPLSPYNDPKYNEASEEFAEHHTDHYDDFADETPSYADAKQLGKIVAVIKWLADNGIATDFNWAYDYSPEFISTPRQFDTIITPPVEGWVMSGGAEYFTPNTYSADNGTSETLKNASEAVNAPKEDIHWTFTSGGQSYESVAVAADSFRSLGSYNTFATDMAFPIAGDLALTFTRSYSSFSGGQQGIGRGWKFLPAQLVDNQPVTPGALRAHCSGETWTHRYKLALSLPDGSRETFTWWCPQAVYKPDDPAYHTKITNTLVNGTTTRLTATLKDQTEYEFEEKTTAHAFKLLSVKDKNGNKINYNYESSSSAKLVSISDENSHNITINYNVNNLISSITDWASRSASYTYDSQGNLLTVTDPRGSVTTYTYDANNKLTSIEDNEENTIITNTYTSEAKLATQVNAASVTKSFTYNNDQRLIIATESASPTRTTKIKYDSKGRILEDIDPLNNKFTYTYATESAPLTIVDKRNNTTTNTYDSNGNLLKVTFPNNKDVEYTYNAQNKVTQISDERYGVSPKVSTFTYDGSGNLLIATESGRTTKYTYNGDGEILTKIDPLNHTFTYTRDSFGNKLTEKDHLDNTTTYSYNTLARLTMQTDPESKNSYFTYDNNGNTLTASNSAGTTSYQYDLNNKLEKIILPNTADTDFLYNASGSLTRVTDALNNETNYGYNSYQNQTSREDALDHTTTYEYDKMNRKTKRTTPLGKILEWQYDANGNITKRIDENSGETDYTYDNMNRLTLITYPNDSEVDFNYDDRGNLTSSVSPAGTTSYEYDIYDRLIEVTDPNSETVSYEYDNADNLTSITYPGSKEVIYTYDEANRIESILDWNDDETTYEYYDNGLLETKTLPNGIVTTYTYDNSNRLTQILHKKGATDIARFTYTRDSLGNIISASESAIFSNPTTQITDNWSSGSIDSNKWEDWSSGKASIVSQQLKIDSNLSGGYYGVDSGVSGKTYNLSGSYVANKLVSAGNQSIGSWEVYPIYAYVNGDSSTQYFWYISENTLRAYKKVSGSNTILASAAYNSTNHKWFRIRESGGTTYFDTSADGATWTNFTSTANAFDVTSLVIGSEVGTWTSEASATNAIFDNFNLPIASTSALTDDWSSGSINSLKWSNWGGARVNVTNQQLTINSTTGSGYYGVDSGINENVYSLKDSSIVNKLISAGNQSIGSWEVYPIYAYVNGDSSTQYFWYLSENTLKAYKKVSGSNTVLASTAYNSTNHKWFRIRESGGTTYFDTSADGLTWTNFTSTANAFTLTSLVIGSEAGTWSSEGSTTSATFDNFNITSSYSTGIKSYSYDLLGRLLSKQSSELDGQSYAYDNVGSILTSSASGQTTNYTNNNDNQLTQQGAISFTYDNKGNQTGRGSTTLTYDFDNRVASYSASGASLIEYTYEGKGERIAKKVGGAVTREFVNDVSGDLTNILIEKNLQTSTDSYFVYGNGLVSQGGVSSGNRQYYLEDGLGNIRAVTNSAGNIVDQYAYDAYGNQTNGGSIAAFKYKGEHLDSNTGLYYMRARYYDPSTGRFISRDPVDGLLTNPRTQNGYNYADADPVNLSDPLGLWTVDFNVSANVGLTPASLTTGLLVSDTGIYTYGGLGVSVKPGAGASIMVSPQSASSGLSVSNSGGVIVGGGASRNLTDGSTSWQVGLTSPSYGWYTTQTNPLWCF